MRFAALLAALLIACGCAAAPQPRQSDPARLSGDPRLTRVAGLQRALSGLDPSVDKREAWILAEEAVDYSAHLASQYRLVRPPILHNMLVNAGLRQRGLCVHWTEDLLTRLKGLQLQTIRLHWGVANRDRSLRIEHSSVIATARGQAFEQGLVLDAWRNSGELYWGPVASDRYGWKPLSP
jgi:hypothetical protein